jgi:hypothetical protein
MYVHRMLCGPWPLSRAPLASSWQREAPQLACARCCARLFAVQLRGCVHGFSPPTSPLTWAFCAGCRLFAIVPVGRRGGGHQLAWGQVRLPCQLPLLECALQTAPAGAGAGAWPRRRAPQLPGRTCVRSITASPVFMSADTISRTAARALLSCIFPIAPMGAAHCATDLPSSSISYSRPRSPVAGGHSRLAVQHHGHRLCGAAAQAVQLLGHLHP